MKLIDNYNRIHDYVRISLIDKCNLNCIYCNPLNSFIKYEFNKSILSYEELYRLIHILVRDLEVKKIRFTGGEPLIRKEIHKFFQMISDLKNKYTFEIGITTNGTNLLDKLELLYKCGVDYLNISLDTLSKEKFISITGKDYFDETLLAIRKALTIPFKSIKINSVIIKGINDNELITFIEFFSNYPITVRFIEYMPFTGNGWDNSKFVSWKDMRKIIEDYYTLKEIESDGKISKDFYVNGTQLKIGFISSISDHFCDACNRLRITATGHIKNCLFTNKSDRTLKPLLSDNTVSDEAISSFILDSLKTKWFKHPEVDELVNMHQNNMISIGG